MTEIERMITDMAESIKTFTANSENYATKSDIVELNEKWKKVEAGFRNTVIANGKPTNRESIEAMFDHLRDYDDLTKAKKVTASADPSSINIGPSAGYLAPSEYVREILRKVEDIGGIRAYARKFTTSTSAIEIPIEESGTEVDFVSEKQMGSDSPPVKYGMRRIPIHGIEGTVAFTREMLADGVFDIEAETNMQLAKSFARKENYGMLYGTGQYLEGLLTSPLVPTENSVNVDLTNKDAPDELIMATANLPYSNQSSYAWYMNFRTLSKLRTLKVPTTSGDGDYAFNFNFDLRNGPLLLLNGFPVRIIPELPQFDEKISQKLVKGKAYSILFGSMPDAYGIVDRQSMDYIRDDTTHKKQRIVEFTFWNRLGAGVLNGSQMLKINTKV